MQEPSRCWSLPGPAPAGCQPARPRRGQRDGGDPSPGRAAVGAGLRGPRVRGRRAGQRGAAGGATLGAFSIAQRGGHGLIGRDAVGMAQDRCQGSSRRPTSTPATGPTAPRAGTRCHGVQRVPHPALVHSGPPGGAWHCGPSTWHAAPRAPGERRTRGATSPRLPVAPSDVCRHQGLQPAMGTLSQTAASHLCRI